MKRTKIYISGKISGLPREEYMRQFREAEENLKVNGYDVVNPTRFAVCKYEWLYKLVGYNLTLLYDLWRLSKCDAIWMLPGWMHSRGATIERTFASNLGLKVKGRYLE